MMSEGCVCCVRAACERMRRAARACVMNESGGKHLYYECMTDNVI